MNMTDHSPTFEPAGLHQQNSTNQEQEKDQKQQVDNDAEQDARFSCNICLDAVTEPVVTRCGHLYCWPCLYKWLLPGTNQAERTFLGIPPSARTRLSGAVIDDSRRTCPVCKSEASVRTVVPIYVRSNSVHHEEGQSQKLRSRQQPTSQITSPTPFSQSATSSPHGETSIPLQAHPQHLEQRQQLLPEDDSRVLDRSPPLIFRQSSNHHVRNLNARSNDQDDDRSGAGTEDMGLNIDANDDNRNYEDSALGYDVPTTITALIPSSADSPDIHLGLGIRQRRGGPGGVVRTESRDEMSTTSTVVPTRPMPSRDRAAPNPDSIEAQNVQDSSSSPTRNSAINIAGDTPTPNHHARATLSYGLVLAMHQTLLNATSTNGVNGSTGVIGNDGVAANNAPPRSNHRTRDGSMDGNTNTEGSNNTNNANQSDLNEFVPSLHYPLGNRESNTSSPTPNSDSDLNLDSDPASTLFLSRLLLGLSLFVLICLLSF